MNYYDKILAGLRLPKAKPYTPKFRIQAEAPDGWRLFDGKRAIGFVANRGGYWFDLWAFSPFAPDIMANVAPPGPVRDLHTVHNSFVNLPYTTGRDLIAGVADLAACFTEKWVKKSGAELELSILGRFPQGQRLAYSFRITYDPTFGQYRFFLDADAWKLDSVGMEPINMMMAGALMDRAETRRWSHSLWEDRDGKLQQLVHSNALFGATDYGDGTGQWRSKNAPSHHPWVAYAAHPEFNPAMLVHETNVPVYFATCSQLFDEHLIWQRAGLETLDEGFFHFIMHTEFVNLPAKLAKGWLQQAGEPPHPKAWRMNAVALALHPDQVNTFEKAVDPWQPEDCPVLVVAPENWATDAAHSGKRSLKITGTCFHQWTTLFPGGAVFFVDKHSRYRLSGWLKTKDVERFARLELATFEYTYSNLIDFGRSEHVGGSTNWTKVSVELDSGDESYIMPRFSIYGTGTVWFDDITLEKISG